MAALRHNKMTAPMMVEGAMTGEMFLAYIEQCLVPTLKRNDIVVMPSGAWHSGGDRESAGDTSLLAESPDQACRLSFNMTGFRFRCASLRGRGLCGATEQRFDKREHKAGYTGQRNEFVSFVDTF